MTALGLDFGTTNTVVAVKAAAGARSLTFSNCEEVTQSLRTCLSFLPVSRQGVRTLTIEAGGMAIRTFVDNPGDCRFLQSIKTFAASRAFSATYVHGRKQTFPDLMEAFLRRIASYAGDDWPSSIDRVVVGRPVRFAGVDPDEATAIERYNEALGRLGFPTIQFVLEPVAAAFYFAQALARDTTVLVADFGGGTTDYSIIRFERQAGAIAARDIAHAGIGIAGDRFDYRIVDNVVSPLIGKGSHYRSFDKRLEIPRNWYTNFGRWNQLSIFKTLKEFTELKALARYAEEPDKLQRFIDLVDYDEGYPLYQAVSRTKLALSDAGEAEFHFAPLGEDSRRMVRLAEFESWIAPDIARMGQCVDDMLAGANMNVGDIDKVFLTGGTSFVPAVRTMFTDRFGAERIESGGELLSIAHGLALIGADQLHNG
ncbi:Hsp70 family protein [Aestuariivirga sp.]|uniref:Hsp70 family protein n=1 Tax=Aestuariivirga sp. TaxID=2650926 RepID=UPI0035935D86